jgi:hypothetical protein
VLTTLPTLLGGALKDWIEEKTGWPPFLLLLLAAVVAAGEGPDEVKGFESVRL